MKNRKRTGSFYTPKTLADFLVNYLADKVVNRKAISVLEPSAGDGIFVNSIYDHPTLSKKISRVDVVEKNKRELNKITNRNKHKTLKAFHRDFLKFQLDNIKKYSIVIGNPPYIRSGLLRPEQINKCKTIHDNANLSDTRPKNIWTSFLVRCINFTADDGILAFVLPSEFLQVKFAAELRELLVREFERVEVFTFNELLFKDCKGQDTLILIGERKSEEKGVYYCNIDKLDDLVKMEFALTKNVKLKDSKWTHSHLESDEIELLEKIRKQILTADDYCTSRAGIVTAANDFFIVDRETVDKYSLHNFIKPIIQKGIFVNGSVELTTQEFNGLSKQSKPSFLIALDKDTSIRSNARLWEYLELGKKRKIHKRYKTSIRDKWYEVPNVGEPEQAFFFKRCNEYPKLIKNSAKVLSTDSAYTILMKENFKIENLIFSFYNSLTLAFAELHGRYYGGGVLELTPNEFKKLPVPYVQLSRDRFPSYVADFKDKESISEVCRRNDTEILKLVINGIDDDSISKLHSIREKLYHRRIKLK